MATMRAFIAVSLAPDTIRRVDKLIGRLQDAGVEARWTPPDNMHLTLKFLGEMQDRQASAVCRAMEGVAEQATPFELKLRGLGCFPDLERPRVMWAGVEEPGASALTALHERLDEAMDRLRFRREPRSYSPHLTIARLRRNRIDGAAPGSVAKCMAPYLDFTAPTTQVDELQLFSSVLDRRRGAQYDLMGTAPLGDVV